MNYVTALALQAEPILEGIREKSAATYSRRQAIEKAKQQAEQDTLDRKISKLNDVFKR